MVVKNKITDEELKYDPIENLEDVKKDMQFFKDLAKKNRHNKKIYKHCMEIVDIFTQQIERIEKDGSIL